MTRSSFSSRISRRLTIDGGLNWQNTIPDNDDLKRAIMSSSTEAVDVIPLSPVRWTSKNGNGGYDAVENRPDSSQNDHMKGGFTFSDSFKTSRFNTEAAFFPEATPSKTGELPKAAIKRGIRANIIKLALHAAPVLVTMAVVQLSFRNVYWMDLLAPNDHALPGLTQAAALSFLQIAAKLHELLILGSLSSVVMHAGQSYLINHVGLPLSLIATLFEVGSGAYILRRSFWSAWFTSDPSIGRRFPFLPFWMLVLFSSSLVLLSGPSSAIAIIPMLDFHNLARPFNQSVFPYYILNQSAPLWPSTLNTGSLTAPNSGITCLDATNAAEQKLCPWGGFNEVSDWALTIPFTNPDKGSNISFLNPLSDRRRVLTTQTCNTTFDGRASGISMNAFLDNALTAYWTFAQKNFHGIALESSRPRLTFDSAVDLYGPRIETLCTVFSNENFTGLNVNDQPDMTFPTFPGSVRKPIPVPDFTYKYERPLNASNLTYVQFPNSEQGSPSLGALFTIPLVVQIVDNGTWLQTTENVACSIYAQWVPMEVWYEPSTSDQVAYSVAADLEDTCLTVPSSPIPGKTPINTTITEGYANAINLVIPFIHGNDTAVRSMIRNYVVNSTLVPNGAFFNPPILGTADPGSHTINPADVALRQRAKLLSIILAGTTTDAMARISGAGVAPFSPTIFLLNNRTTSQELIGRYVVSSASGGLDESLNTTNAADVNNWLLLEPKIQRFGYGYHWNGSRITQLGILILLVHAVVAITHTLIILYMIFGLKKGMPNSWETIPEMIAVAINSKSSEKLRNTCAGINETQTWKIPFGVRETSDGHLEFAFGKDEMDRNPPPRAGVKYGALPVAALTDFEEGGLRRRVVQT